MLRLFELSSQLVSAINWFHVANVQEKTNACCAYRKDYTHKPYSQFHLCGMVRGFLLLQYDKIQRNSRSLFSWQLAGSLWVLSNTVRKPGINKSFRFSVWVTGRFIKLKNEQFSWYHILIRVDHLRDNWTNLSVNCKWVFKNTSQQMKWDQLSSWDIAKAVKNAWKQPIKQMTDDKLKYIKCWSPGFAQP